MQTKKPEHAPQTQFAVADNCLLVGGIPLPRVVHRAGATPLYAYDRALLSARVQVLKQVCPTELRINYSLKANPYPALVQHMASLVDGFDVASSAEMQTALSTGIDAGHISFTGPGKTDAELRQAIAAGVMIHVESTNELRRIDQLSRELGYLAQVMLRINPDFELKSSGLKMAGGAKQFGIDVEQIPAVLKALADMTIQCVGFHIYAGSQNLNAAAINETLTKSCELAISLAQIAIGAQRHWVRRINLGGGFGIPYFPGDTPLDIAAIGQHLQDCVAKLQKTIPHVETEIELGRYLVGEAGIYVTRVIDKKFSRGQCFLVTDGGMNHHLAASGNLGQVIRKNYPVIVGNKVKVESEQPASVVGPLCTPLDLLADQMPLSHAEVGDFIVVFQSGAYGASASPANFLSRPAAVEVLV
ncbi:pyridoxal-dependent decarboxylase, exosortase A system-associated [Sapientia aquatica]|uniref:Pyridoxal-dependent decarboxylase, exosortase A system-associated n=1 Tax=Sapientia aquatica TaxID=1549640 RepID=A0A4R5W180_9BURK|nr:pyridoxal-dependent decarboxylase, exosortase A system-associated [Sapientia aquatica]TDK65664.1 pyridoxal-dependent decarboxylase, exosortase A system-associated [Sapientia aquatica]